MKEPTDLEILNDYIKYELGFEKNEYISNTCIEKRISIRFWIVWNPKSQKLRLEKRGNWSALGAMYESIDSIEFDHPIMTCREAGMMVMLMKSLIA